MEVFRGSKNVQKKDRRDEPCHECALLQCWLHVRPGCMEIGRGPKPLHVDSKLRFFPFYAISRGTQLHKANVFCKAALAVNYSILVGSRRVCSRNALPSRFSLSMAPAGSRANPLGLVSMPRSLRLIKRIFQRPCWI
jgi:hypothetical protein